MSGATMTTTTTVPWQIPSLMDSHHQVISISALGPGQLFRKVSNRSKSAAVMLALFKLGHYLTDIDCYEKLTTRREARQQRQWTFRSSIAMKQMGKKKEKSENL